MLNSIPVCTEDILSTLCTCKSNTASLSQEIITAISSLALSLAATLIGWNYFRKQLAAAPRGALKLSQRLAGTRGRQPMSVCKHPLIPPVSLSQCLQPIRHMSFVSFDSDSTTRTPPETTAASAFPPRRPRTTWPAFGTVESEGEKKNTHRIKKRDKEVCVSAGYASNQLMDSAEIWGSPSKTMGRAWTVSLRRDKAQGYGRWWQVGTPLWGSGSLTGNERQMGFVLKRKAIDEGKNRSLW